MNCVALLFLVISTVLSSTIQIKNITAPTNLTQIYFGNFDYSFTTLNPGFLTYYDQYLWLGIYSNWNETVSYLYNDELEYSIKSDIFDSEFKQYNNNNLNLPFAVSNRTLINESWWNQLALNFGCTSPITNDILDCWDNFTWIEDRITLIATVTIHCKIFYYSTSKWSNIIHINPSINTTLKKKYVEYNLGINAICFNDSYFIPYSYQYQDISPINPQLISNIRSAILDLNGNIIYENITLNSNVSVELVTFSTIGSNQFIKTIENKYNVRDVTGSFMLIYENYLYETNMTNITGMFGYYTSLNDNQFPIYIYNQKTITNNNDTSIFKGDEYIQLSPNIVLDFNNECCYISIYAPPTKNNSDENDYFFDIFLIISDYDGNNILEEDQLILPNVPDDVDPQIIDLSMISNDDDNIHYFMVTFGIGGNEYGYSHTIAVAIYSLEYNVNTNKYTLSDSENLDIIKRQHNDEWGFAQCIGYVMPKTNDLYVAWSEFYGFGDASDIYGQIFTVN